MIKSSFKLEKKCIAQKRNNVHFLKILSLKILEISKKFISFKLYFYFFSPILNKKSTTEQKIHLQNDESSQIKS